MNPNYFIYFEVKWPAMCIYVLKTHYLTDLAISSKSAVISAMKSCIFWPFALVATTHSEISAFASDSCCTFRANIDIFAPLLANSFATSLPMPFEPPVIKTCLPCKLTVRSWTKLSAKFMTKSNYIMKPYYYSILHNISEPWLFMFMF